MPNSWRQNLSPAAAAFLLPNFLGFCLFTVFPVILSFGMAFTNWSLKPAIPFRFIGLRNLTDLLWVQARGQAAPGLSAVYYLSALLLVAGLVLSLLAAIARWRGLRVAGGAISALSVAALLTAAVMVVYRVTRWFFSAMKRRENVCSLLERPVAARPSSKRATTPAAPSSTSAMILPWLCGPNRLPGGR